MEKDYYDILEIEQNSSSEEIKKAYKRLAVKYHPDKNHSPGAAEKFKEISEAYQVLSNPDKKRHYDSHSQRKNSINMDFFMDNNNMFKNFFDSNYHTGAGKEFTFNNSFHLIYKIRNQKMKNRGSCEHRTNPYKQDPPIYYNIYVQLEDILKGATKTLKITRTIYASDGTKEKESIEVKVDIKKGTKQGTEFRFKKLGDKRPNAIPADIIFKVQQLEHKLFTRQDNDLVFVRKITKEELDNHPILIVPVLDDGKSIFLNHYNQKEIRIPNYGLPCKVDPSVRGDLIVKVKIVDE